MGGWRAVTARGHRAWMAKEPTRFRRRRRCGWTCTGRALVAPDGGETAKIYRTFPSCERFEGTIVPPGTVTRSPSYGILVIYPRTTHPR